MLTMIIYATDDMANKTVSRSIRRHTRNTGWWDLVWQSYDEHRFKETFRVTRATFMYILQKIGPDLTKQTLVEEPILPELRIAICLYRLGRGDYLYTISELTALGKSTVCCIVIEVCQQIISSLWECSVEKHFPSNKEEFNEAVMDMEQLWQFPYSLFMDYNNYAFNSTHRKFDI